MRRPHWGRRPCWPSALSAPSPPTPPRRRPCTYRREVDGTASGPVVTVDPGVTGVTLNDLTIENGSLGVYNSEGTLRLTDSTVSGNANVAEPYAGILNYTDSTTTSVTLSPATVTAGTRVIYLVVVTPKSGTGTPAGTISFATGSTSLCTAVLSGGVAACGATSAPAGTDKVTGTYSGGDGYASSSGTATLTVTKA